MNLKLVSGMTVLVLGIAACSCSGSSPTSAPPPVPVPTVAPPGSSLTSADVSFVVPPPVTLQLAQSVGRRPRYVSAGTTKFTLVEDGATIISQASVFASGTYSAPNGSTFTVTSTAGPQGQLVDVHFTTLPGTHTIGILTSDSAPRPNVLSEGQETWVISPGSPASNNRAITLAGVVGTGYIECPVLAEIADTTRTCSNYSNFSAGKFHLVALAGDADGYPIYFQPGVNFDNGQITVVETTPGDHILAIDPAGPWSNPGTALSASGFSAGNSFTASCAKVGTATVALTGTNGQGTVTGINYANFTLPPPASILPHGPSSIGATPLPGDALITCTSSMTLQLI